MSALVSAGMSSADDVAGALDDQRRKYKPSLQFSDCSWAIVGLGKISLRRKNADRGVVMGKVEHFHRNVNLRPVLKISGVGFRKGGC